MTSATQMIDSLVAQAVDYPAGMTNEFVDMTPITVNELENSPVSKRAIVPHFLYADVRQRVAPGGVGKTTVAVFEMLVLALGQKLWGYDCPRPVKSVLITREDTRAILVGRMREIIRACGFTEIERSRILANVLIIDVTAQNLRLTHIEGDVPRPHLDNVSRLVEALKPFNPDWVIFDPAVSFGVGESRINDAEQALIEAARIIVNRLDCCVEYIHHSGKQNARDGATDQYAGRGGSALADGCRMVAALQPLSDEDFAQRTGKSLDEGEHGLVMALPKLSYTAKQDDVLIRRNGFRFEHVTGIAAMSAQQRQDADAEAVLAFIEAEWHKGARFSKNALESNTEVLGLTRNRIRNAVNHLIAYGRLSQDTNKHAKGNCLVPMFASTNGEVPVKMEAK